MNHRCPSTQGYFILSVRQLNTQCFSYRNVLLFLSKKLKLISENVKKKLQSDKFNFIYVCAAKSNKNKKVVYIFSSFHPLIKLLYHISWTSVYCVTLDIILLFIRICRYCIPICSLYSGYILLLAKHTE